MNELKNISLIGKIFGFFVFILGYILVLSLLLLGLFSFIPNQVLFYTPFLILVTAVIFSMLWQFFQKNLFETLLICFCFRFWPYPWHVEVPGPGIEPVPWQ